MKISLVENKADKGLDFDDDVEAGDFFVGVNKSSGERYLYYKFSDEEYIAMSFSGGHNWGDACVAKRENLETANEYIERRFRVDKWEY